MAVFLFLSIIPPLPPRACREGGGPGYPLHLNMEVDIQAKISIERRLWMGASSQRVSKELALVIHKSLHATTPKSLSSKHRLLVMNTIPDGDLKCLLILVCFLCRSCSMPACHLTHHFYGVWCEAFGTNIM